MRDPMVPAPSTAARRIRNGKATAGIGKATAGSGKAAADGEVVLMGGSPCWILSGREPVYRFVDRAGLSSRDLLNIRRAGSKVILSADPSALSADPSYLRADPPNAPLPDAALLEAQ